jgi:hypothetical protein
MPQSLSIGAFVFGAVLVLLSLVVGKFKLFGAEVDGTVGKGARIIAFFFGIFLIGTSLGLNNDHPNNDHSGGTQPQPGSPNQASVGGQTSAPASGSIVPKTEEASALRQTAVVPETREVDPVRKLQEFVEGGIWQSNGLDANTGIPSTFRTRFSPNGSFSMTESGVVYGVPTTVPFSGTWTVSPISSERFLITLNYAGGNMQTQTVRVIDHNLVENEQTSIVLHRVPE